MEAELVAATICALPSSAAPVQGDAAQKLIVPEVTAGPAVGTTVAVSVIMLIDVSGAAGEVVSVTVDG